MPLYELFTYFELFAGIFPQFLPRGYLKKFGQALGLLFEYEIWPKFTFGGKKKWNYFWGSDFFYIIFRGSYEVLKFIFGS